MKKWGFLVRKLLVMARQQWQSIKPNVGPSEGGALCAARREGAKLGLEPQQAGAQLSPLQDS